MNIFSLKTTCVALLSAVLLAGCGAPTSSNQTLSDMKNPQNPVVTFETTEGDIQLEIYTDQVPTIGGSFVSHVEAGNYDETVFHRIIAGFMIQGGDFQNGNGTGGEAFGGGYLPDEIVPGLSNVAGTISMANRNRGIPGEAPSNGSQFFINEVDNVYLDGRHTVFGAVIGGQDVVAKIAAVETDAANKPKQDVMINKATVVTAQ